MTATDKNIYFASDFHLGYPTLADSKDRELTIVRWLDSIKLTASDVFLLGDIFDFWYEYKYVVPRGYVRFLGKLAELADAGVNIHIFTGNHDVWMFDYFTTEIGAKIYREPLDICFGGKRFFLHHGDALGSYDKGMNAIKKVFTNKFLQWCFSRVHPNFAFWLAFSWSHHSRESAKGETYKYLGDDKEWLVLYAKEVLEKENFDYFVFGHRHFDTIKEIAKGVRYVNLGTWLYGCPYAVFDGKEMKIEQFEG